ncbi:hypothetical protein AVEN_252852-1 [Araneus ventricosus]|uniref:Uncharacterized protein n=1 Tax=Araneus ventricosus TaxID=182803 RepID=A0A4Y2NAM6_ARAVE|nr:hypothetical protein AVEN_252852-1 [Araneus ventricosus]
MSLINSGPCSRNVGFRTTGSWVRDPIPRKVSDTKCTVSNILPLVACGKELGSPPRRNPRLLTMVQNNDLLPIIVLVYFQNGTLILQTNPSYHLPYIPP